MPRANWNALVEFEIIYPNNKLIKEYNTLFINIIEENKNLAHSNQNLKEARDLLLPRMMSGMIDVDEVKMPAVGYDIKEGDVSMAAEGDVGYELS